MEITQLFIYPVKSLRGVAVEHAVVVENGFLYDRCYVLLKEGQLAQGKPNLECIIIGLIPELALFMTSIKFPEGDDEGLCTVTFNPPNAPSSSLVLPLQPDITPLDTLDVTMHGSPCAAYDMGARYNEWFTKCFGYPVKLAAIGENLRPVLFAKDTSNEAAKSSWLSSITSTISSLGADSNEERKIKFQDVAPFLVVTEKSCENVSDRLPAGESMDIRKFRPNIVVSGEKEWDEDFWAEIKVGGDDEGIRLPLQHNCIRCQSLNIDFATGKYSKGTSGEVLKTMMKDRRVDTKKKYSPVFGRYGFTTRDSLGKTMRLGDAVTVTKRNEQRTGFDWPGL